MKIKIIYPIVGLALLIATPQVHAQSKSAERKIKREMRKLEKQMQKVQELKHDAYLPFFEEMEIKRYKELENLEELKGLKWEIQQEQTEMAREQAEKAREMAELFREENMHRFQEHRELAKEYQIKTQQELRRALEKQRHELDKIREYYPDGIHMEEIEIPELDIEIPEFDFKFDFPEKEFEFKNFDGKAPLVYRGLGYTFESENNLTVNTDLDSESIDKTYEYTVSDEAGSLALKAHGSVSEGNLNIEIKTPQDDEYQTIELSPAADVDWSQKIKISEDKKENYQGKWTIRIKGDNVKGHFGVSLRSR